VRGLLFQALLRKLDGEVPKKLAQKEKKNYESSSAHFDQPLREIQTRETGSAFAVYTATLLYRGTLPTDRQTVLLNVRFYCSILPIYMNLYGAIWSYLPRNSRTLGGSDHSDMLGGQRFGPSIAHHCFVTNVHPDAGLFFDPRPSD